MKRSFTVCMVAISVVAIMGLSACSAPGGASSASASASASASSAASSPASSASAAASSSASASSASAATPGAASSSAATSSAASSAASAGAAGAPAVNADGKQLATGTVVTTTYKDRAAEVGLAGDDYANDTGLLTLLVLNEPVQVTAYKGGGDYTGPASVICLPNDEMFRQFSGKEITIGVNSWGEWPADLSGKLYDLVLDFDADGLDLVEYPAQ